MHRCRQYTVNLYSIGDTMPHLSTPQPLPPGPLLVNALPASVQAFARQIRPKGLHLTTFAQQLQA